LQDPHNIQELSGAFRWEQATIQKGLQELEDSGHVEIWKEDNTLLYWSREAAEQWREHLNQLVSSYQKEYPLRGGISREELKVKLGVKWTQRRWQNILEEGAEKDFYRIIGSKVNSIDDLKLPEPLMQKIDCLKRRWQNAGLMPPELEAGALECGISKGASPEFASYLVEQEEWITITGMYFNFNNVSIAQKELVNLLQKNEEVTVGDVRELWKISRKYAVPLLEYFDQQKVTKRLGDKRVLCR
jgi:selenocysteine-specific elongation factor